VTWWAIVATPTDGRHLYELGEEGPTRPDEGPFDEGPFDEDVAAIRALHSIPADWLERRLDRGEDWMLQLTQGDPHPELLWSPEELSAARDALEAQEDTRGQRAKIKAVRDALEGAGDKLPRETRKTLTDEVERIERSIKAPDLAKVRAKLAREVPPSRATIHGKPPKPPKDSTPKG
jgi:hypothetical protein